jgi:hypothetical protein
MSTKNKLEAQNPLILRCHRLMEAFAKSDDERDFYIDRLEGFLIYVDLDKPQEELEGLERELKENVDRYCLIPKLSFYETKKIMEGFVNEKVYDIDTKEKLLDIIQSKEARENFLEFIYDHHAEQEKWQQFYQERSRIRIIEWLRTNHFHFVFEEDLDLPRYLIEKLKEFLFQTKVSKEIISARKALVTKAKIYYSNEALNPRPKRGRPPKQTVKPDVETHQVTIDIYTSVPPFLRPFLFTPELTAASSFSAFSSKFESEDPLNRLNLSGEQDGSLNQKLSALRGLSSRWLEKPEVPSLMEDPLFDTSFDEEDEEDEEDEFGDEDEDEDEFSTPKTKLKKSKIEKQKGEKAKPSKPSKPSKSSKSSKAPTKATAKSKNVTKSEKSEKPEKSEKKKAKRIMPVSKKEPQESKKGLKKLIPRKLTPKKPKE